METKVTLRLTDNKSYTFSMKEAKQLWIELGKLKQLFVNNDAQSWNMDVASLVYENSTYMVED